jgi:3-oxoacyl-[acyl-carrier-protein] synthase-1
MPTITFIQRRTLRPLAVTAYTVVNCLGPGRRATLEALAARRSGLMPCAFDDARIDACAGQIPDSLLAPVTGDLVRFDCRNHRIAQLALGQDGFEGAVRDAASRLGHDRVAVVLGTSTSGILQTELAYRERDPASGALPAGFHYATTHSTYSLTAYVQQRLGLTGPSLVVSTACSSSAKVFGAAARMIAAGWCDAAVVGGADSLCLTTLYGFNSLQLLSRGRCRPFDVARDGISIGEGGGFALLQPAETAPPGSLALLGVGESSDGYHMSSPHPEGLGAKLAMQRALCAAGLRAEDIDYINLHGTGTRSNDSSEGKAVHDLFGRNTPASSIKGALGHTLGACGIQEAVACLLAIENGFVPGSASTQTVDPAIEVDYAVENRPARVARAMSNSFGFGGSNCTLVFGRLPA